MGSGLAIVAAKSMAGFYSRLLEVDRVVGETRKRAVRAMGGQ
jgi:hypothetical protein